MATRENIPVFGIAGTSFSGTTLLSFLFGAHSKVFSTGEACQLFAYLRNNDSKNESVRTCSIHHDRCKFWTPAFIKQCEDAHISTLYDRVSAFLPSSTLVMHSFKDSKRYGRLANSSNLNGLIMLFKRPVAYYYSAKVHEQKTTQQAANNYVKVNVQILDLAARKNIPILPVFYDDFATNPETVLSKLCDWIGLSYEPQMTEPWNQTDRLHTIGGNAGTYMHVWDERTREGVLNSEYWEKEHSEENRQWILNNFRSIKLDEKWKLLPSEEIREIEACTASREMFEELMAQSAVAKSSASSS